MRRWLGRQGSNLRMTGSKPVALPLGYAPTRRAANISEHPASMQRRNVTCDPFLVYNPVMVDPNMPWSLKGVSDEAREFAKLSSDQSGIPVGVWLSQVIRAAASPLDAMTPDPVPGPMAETPPEFDLLRPNSDPLEKAPAHRTSPGAGGGGSTIERAAQMVGDFGFEPEGPARDADLIEDPEMLQAELLALERRLESAEASTQENLSPLMDEIERIRARLSDFGNT
jgi:hypothetical protein